MIFPQSAQAVDTSLISGTSTLCPMRYPLEDLLRILREFPMTLSRSEARRLADEASLDALAACLAPGGEEHTAIRAALILAMGGREDTVHVLAREIARSEPGATLQMMLRALADCGPSGRLRLLELSRQDGVKQDALDALVHASSHPTFRPAALARLAELSDDESLTFDVRRKAARFVMQKAWAAGREAVSRLQATVGSKHLAESWEASGWPAQGSLLSDDPWSWFLFDYEAGNMRSWLCSEDANTRERQELEGRILAQASTCLESMAGALRVGRNDPCPCGSGKKYKKCCVDAPRMDLLARFLLDVPHAALGIHVSPFDRPADEQVLLAIVASQGDPGKLPHHVDGHPYVAWMACRRLMAVGRTKHALDLALEILEQWDVESGLSRDTLLRVIAYLACTDLNDHLPKVVGTVARHAEPLTLFAVAEQLERERHDVGFLLAAVLEHRREDPEALLAVCASIGMDQRLHETDDNERALVALDECLATHSQVESAGEARQRVAHLLARFHGDAAAVLDIEDYDGDFDNPKPCPGKIRRLSRDSCQCSRLSTCSPGSSHRMCLP